MRRNKPPKKPSPFPNCGKETNEMRVAAYSMKFNANFCNQQCYEQYREKLASGQSTEK